MLRLVFPWKIFSKPKSGIRYCEIIREVVRRAPEIQEVELENALRQSDMSTRQAIESALETSFGVLKSGYSSRQDCGILSFLRAVTLKFV